MAVIKTGTTIGFGLQSAAEGGAAATVSGYTLTTKQEVKEMRNSIGEVKAVAFHKKTDDISVDFVGAPVQTHHVGGVLNAAYEASTADEIYVDEVSIEVSSEGHRTTSIKATGYYDGG